MPMHRTGLIAGMVLLVIVSSPAAWGQTAMATARGTVTDAQGGVLPGVTITIRNVATNVSRTGTTDEGGRYLVPNLAAGSYEITAELQGFSTARRAFVLTVGQEGTIDLKLQMASIGETITVSGQTALVETQHTVGAHLSTTDIDALPTLSRDFTELAKLAPGVLARSTGFTGSGFSANGVKQFQNNIVVDGATNTMQFYGLQSDLYPQDWVQEFQVMTNGFSAEFGQASGAVVNVITRSGSNRVSGRFYTFIRDDKFDSPPFSGRFVNGQPEFLTETPPFTQPRIGGFFSGPIVRNKAFFFVGVEDLERTATRILSISDYWRNQGVDYQIPTKDINRAFLFKGDWTLNPSNSLTIRHNRTVKRDTNCTGQGGDGCPGDTLATLEKSASFEGPIWSLMANWATTLSGRAFNEFRAAYNVNDLYIKGNAAGGLYGKALVEQNTNGRFSVRTYPGAEFGNTDTSGLEGETNLYFIDNFTLVRSSHQLKFGGTLARVDFHMDLDTAHKGKWFFPVDRVFNANDPVSYPDQFQFAAPPGSGTWFEPRWKGGLFVQDTWQVRNNLTVNFGIRYDVDNTIQTGNAAIDGYNQRIQAKFGGDIVQPPLKKDLNNFAPRVGFVWLPTVSRRTAIRASAGVFYDEHHANYNDVPLNETWQTDTRITINCNNSTGNPFWNSANTAAGVASCRSFLAAHYPGDFAALVAAVPLGKLQNFGMAPDFRIPYTITLASGFTHTFTNNLLIQADYVHSRANDVVMSKDFNIVAVLSPTTAVSGDPRFSSKSWQFNGGWIKYDALQTHTEWRRAKAQLGASYTLSKATSNNSSTSVGGGGATNPLDLSIDIGPTSEDRRHNFVLDGSYVLPADFQVAAIWRGASAVPYSVTSRFVTFARVEPRNSRRGDAEWNLDLRLAKNFSLPRKVKIGAFWEMFNATNTRNFVSYQGAMEASNFLQPRSILPMRRQQLGFKIDF